MERTKRTIDRPLTVGAGEEEYFGDMDITLKTDIRAEGRLVFRNCLIHGSSWGTTLLAAEASIDGAIFEDCPIIYCTALSNCTLINCGDINVDDGYISGCRFEELGSIFADSSDIVRCSFSHLRYSGPEDECLIILSDCRMQDCDFSDVELRGGSLLVEATDEWAIRRCNFKDCRTERRDGKLCSGTKTVGVLRKREVEIDVLDESSCTGLDIVHYI